MQLRYVGVAVAGLLVGMAGCAGGSTTGGDGGSGTGTGSQGGGGGCVPTTETCDGIDNDCNGEVDEGCACSAGDTQECYSGDPALVGVGACAMGTQTCDPNGAWGPCTGEVLPDDEQCNNVDDDCNGEVDEGFGMVTCGLGICQVTVDECLDGVPNPCEPGTPEPMELCNGGIDDDCDGDSDEGCTCTNGETQPCYTGSPATQNVGECSDGTQTCTDGAWGACLGDTTPTAELCNGLDDNCDGVNDDGDPGGGSICNTGMSGICGPGVEHCVPSGMGASVVCVPNQMPGVEICDGLDNDCNPATPDGAANPNFGMPCDGMDTDLCPEGSWGCVNSQMTCSDNTNSTIDLCNGMDDDCDPASADGSEDPAVGQQCDGADTDLCLEGTNGCSGGAITCSDNTASTTEECNNFDDDCDGQVDEGFVRNDNPLCSSGVFPIGSVSGDTATSTVLTDSWYNEEWDVVTITEDSNSSSYLSATVVLNVPAGVDYDLYVYCNNCTGNLAGSSTITGTTGHTEVVDLRSNDDFAVDDSFQAIIEVRHKSSMMCAFWDLQVVGFTVVNNETCN
ncbi:MAG: MopE-related protein [Polyangiaceae bacterium]